MRMRKSINYINIKHLLNQCLIMIISEHALEEMEESEVTEEEVKACLEHGELEIKQVVDGEMRYGNKLALKDKTIMVIYTHRDDEQRVITCYPIWRKRQW